MNILRFLIPKSSVEYIYDTSTVRQALEKMRYHHYVAIPMLDSEGHYIGTLRQENLIKFYAYNNSYRPEAGENTSALEILDRDYCKPLYQNADINVLFEMLKERNFVPVIDDRDYFIGIILRRDVLGFLQDFYNKHKNT